MATATNAGAIARYRTTDLRDTDPPSYCSLCVGGGGRRGEEDKDVCSQGTEGTENLELGRFLAEMDDEYCKKNENDGDIG